MESKPLFLVVEDNADHRNLLEMGYLRTDQSCNILFAEDGLEALALLETMPVKPSLMLLDVDLPRLNGLGLMHQLRASMKWRHLPIVMMSSNDDPKLVNQAYQDGANSFLGKPKNYNEFKNIWKNIFDFWTFTARLPS